MKKKSSLRTKTCNSIEIDAGFISVITEIVIKKGFAEMENSCVSGLVRKEAFPLGNKTLPRLLLDIKKVDAKLLNHKTLANDLTHFAKLIAENPKVVEALANGLKDPAVLVKAGKMLGISKRDVKAHGPRWISSFAVLATGLLLALWDEPKNNNDDWEALKLWLETVTAAAIDAIIPGLGAALTLGIHSKDILCAYWLLEIDKKMSNLSIQIARDPGNQTLVDQYQLLSDLRERLIKVCK